MKIRPEDLEAEGYTLIDKLDHSELIPFVKKNLNKWSYISIFFYSINLILLLAGILSIYISFTYKNAEIGDVVFHYCFGFTICFLLIPIHEYIHVLAYRYLGAKETSFDYNLKKFYFMALANNFVANRREFAFVALFPFTLISFFLFILYFYADNNWQITLLSTLFLHTAMCSGDFGLLNFFYINKNKNVVTYDDTTNKISFFYIK
ncbi:DUF3267 domain-containing protein [Lunatimonas lonarensis]|uniref:DUF3267 domain-containing protein n=1 Tax=Lunatimonas lonarensis TaxID=1232681 RepID=UPI00056402E2|nr:DUF3267 domain-containing protein [Lunatimonas lonarensis]